MESQLCVTGVCRKMKQRGANPNKIKQNKFKIQDLESWKSKIRTDCIKTSDYVILLHLIESTGPI